MDEEEIDRTIRAIIGRCKDHVCKTNNKKTVNGMKSVSFLLKKMFVCSSGFAPTPSLRDTLPESRMEKVNKFKFMYNFFRKSTYNIVFDQIFKIDKLYRSF